MSPPAPPLTVSTAVIVVVYKTSRSSCMATHYMDMDKVTPSPRLDVLSPSPYLLGTLVQQQVGLFPFLFPIYTRSQSSKLAQALDDLLHCRPALFKPHFPALRTFTLSGL